MGRAVFSFPFRSLALSFPHVKSSMSIKRKWFPAEGDWIRKRRLRALKFGLIGGLVCAALVGLLLYLVYLETVQ
jgi:hypothetical protein